MVKRREPQASVASIARREPTQEQVEAFAAAADGGSVQKKAELLDEKTFKSIRVSLSKSEYNQLHEAAKKVGRSKLSFIRRAIFEMAEDLLEGNEKGA